MSLAEKITMNAARFPNAPASIAGLPTDRRGFPVPWFIEWIDGEPDFRVADSRKLRLAVKQKRCWICGGKLGRMLAFVIGPMCGVNRISSEPPSHPQCAAFAAEACRFLSRPLAKRPPTGALERKFGTAGEMPGVPLLHNPGVTLVWWTLRYKISDANPGILFHIGPPERAQWFREGRQATRQEVLDGIEIGLPNLLDLAEAESPAAVLEVHHSLQRLFPLIPA